MRAVAIYIHEGKQHFKIINKRTRRYVQIDWSLDGAEVSQSSHIYSKSHNFDGCLEVPLDELLEILEAYVEYKKSGGELE